MNFSSLYTDETAENLYALGYEAAFVRDLVGGEDIALQIYTGEASDKVIRFYTVVLESMVMQGNQRSFIAKAEQGFSIPISCSKDVGIYIRKRKD